MSRRAEKMRIVRIATTNIEFLSRASSFTPYLQKNLHYERSQWTQMSPRVQFALSLPPYCVRQFGGSYLMPSYVSRDKPESLLKFYSKVKTAENFLQEYSVVDSDFKREEENTGNSLVKAGA